MKEKMVRKLLAMLMLLVMLCGVAFAEQTVEEAAVIPGNMPERGIIFPFTDEDVNELSIGASYMVAATLDVAEVPVAYLTFTDEEGVEKTMAAYSEADVEDEEVVWNFLIELLSHSHNIYTIIMFEKDYYDAQIASGKTANDILDVDNAEVLGENGGYVYVGVDTSMDMVAAMETDTQKALAEKVVARSKELIAGMTFQPIVFAEGEFTEIPESAITFTTQDLNGNTVTNDLFLGKKLTVLNVWGTFCTPCIEEMPELAEWSQNMPEGVQLVGLVSDLHSADNTDVLETAQYICEATGADVYTHLISGADFADLLDGVVGVPTTFFINGNGEFVGDPVVGANVPALKAFVESYMAE